MSLPLFTRARIEGQPRESILKVVGLEEFLRGNREADDCALWMDASLETARSRAATDIAWGAVIPEVCGVSRPEGSLAQCWVSDIRNREVVAPGDVVRINHRSGLLSVVHRRSSRTNSLLVTERCNSYCLMCSQPPIERDDDEARLQELLRVATLMDGKEPFLGITGGEPTLLGTRFVTLISGCRSRLPTTTFHVLTNGRTFADEQFSSDCARAAGNSVIWAIPLYTDSPETHDFVVQRRGAFVETMQGLLHLAKLNQRIELRIVLQRATVPRLKEFAHFIARNLNFVDHVAWMGLEPMGFARPNWNKVWIDPESYAADLGEAIALLDRSDISTSIFNLPLCVLPRTLWPYAARSISEWKNTYGAECNACLVRDRCGGIFESAQGAYKSGRIAPVTSTPLQDNAGGVMA